MLVPCAVSKTAHTNQTKKEFDLGTLEHTLSIISTLSKCLRDRAVASYLIYHNAEFAAGVLEHLTSKPLLRRASRGAFCDSMAGGRQRRRCPNIAVMKGWSVSLLYR